MAVAGIPVGGSRPFGWNDDKRTLHPVESELIRKARIDVLADVGLHTICREWQKAGIKTPRGNEFVRPVLRSILLSPRLAGYRVHRKDICLDRDGNKVMGQHEAILTVPEWEELRDYLTQEGRQRQNVHKGGRKYLLSGIARCAVCGAALRGGWDNRWNNFNYSCPQPTAGGCGKVAINGPKLDALVTDLIFAYLAGKTVQTDSKPWQREEELAHKEVKVKELMSAYHDDQLPKELVFPEIAKLSAEIAELKRDRSQWNREQLRAAKTSSNIIDLWPDMETDRRRAVVETLIHTVVIKPRLKPQARFDPERADVVWR
jgi:site-specific DNA recombinase